MKWLVIPVLLLTACASTPPEPPPPALARADYENGLAADAFRRARYVPAAQHWRAAARIYQSVDRWESRGAAQLSAALALSRLGLVSQAEELIAPMPDEVRFPVDLRVQAAWQLALLSAREDPSRSAKWLAQSRGLCALPCALQDGLDNLGARLALPQDPAGAHTLADAVLARGERVSVAERAHAYRLRAEAALLLGDVVQAASDIRRALDLDRRLADSVALLDDYRLLVRIAAAVGDADGARDAEQRAAAIADARR
ncbi:hypothetical protein ACTSKR_09300 [Chitinibacteraceae bacterium HSL-7]